MEKSWSRISLNCQKGVLSPWFCGSKHFKNKLDQIVTISAIATTVLSCQKHDVVIAETDCIQFYDQKQNCWAKFISGPVPWSR